MYRVIIVDDEKQISDGLCKMIRWSEMGFEVCGTARNGLEAINLLKSGNVDLVIADVRMPVMDGIKLLEHVRNEISEDIEFIILSGFSEFQYAQKAVQYNARNYLLKPVDEDELYTTLLDIKSVLDEKVVRKSLRVRSYINSYIIGEEEAGNEEILGNEETYGLRYISVDLHRDIDSLGSYTQESENSIDLFKCIAELFTDSNMRFVLRHDRHRCHIVAGRSLLGSYGYDVRLLASELRKFFSLKKGIQVDVLVGKKVPGFRELHESIRSIELCRNKLFYRKSASVITYDEIMEEVFCKVYEDNGTVIRIISAFRKNDMNKLVKEVDDLAAHFQQLKVVPEIVLIHLDSIMASVVQILNERSDDTAAILDLYAGYKKVYDKLDIYELVRLVKEFCLFCNDFSLSIQKNETMDLVDKVARFVDGNYMEPIKITDIAERFYVNSAYLGQQFSKKKGCSLNHYINMVRIEKAKELLLNTNHRVYEIAQETGFEDPNYFSSKFFEYTGQTPSDFRGQIRKTASLVLSCSDL
jgi:two-component system response regulator YesN